MTFCYDMFFCNMNLVVVLKYSDTNSGAVSRFVMNKSSLPPSVAAIEKSS
jgi:hypothetical protein